MLGVPNLKSFEPELASLPEAATYWVADSGVLSFVVVELQGLISGYDGI